MGAFPHHWPLVRDTTSHRWIPFTKASDAELWCAPATTNEQTLELPVISEAMTPKWRHCSYMQHWYCKDERFLTFHEKGFSLHVQPQCCRMVRITNLFSYIANYKQPKKALLIVLTTYPLNLFLVHELIENRLHDVCLFFPSQFFLLPIIENYCCVFSIGLSGIVFTALPCTKGKIQYACYRF